MGQHAPRKLAERRTHPAGLFVLFERHDGGARWYVSEPIVDLDRNDVKDELDALELAHVIGVVDGVSGSGTGVEDLIYHSRLIAEGRFIRRHC